MAAWLHCLGKSSELNTKELEVTKVGNLKYLLSIMKYLLIRKMVGKQPHLLDQLTSIIKVFVWNTFNVSLFQQVQMCNECL